MNEAELRQFEERVLNVIKLETHEALKHTGHAWIEDAVRKIVPLVTYDTLTRLGVQIEPPFEMQADFQHLRRIRLESEDTRKAIRKTFVNYCVNGMISLFIAGGAAWIMVKGLVAKVP